MATFGTLLLFALTVAGVIARPFKIGEAWFAGGGAALMLAFGLVSPAAVLGVNLGPNITIVGSLATMLRRTTLARSGITVGSGELARVGLCVTVPALIAACAALWIATR